MNFYARSEDAFGEADIRVASMFAAQAALVLTNAQAYWDSRSLDESLGELTAGRAIIEQARGVLMATTGRSAEHAGDVLAARARREAMPIRDVASAIVRDAAVADIGFDGERRTGDDGGPV